MELNYLKTGMKICTSKIGIFYELLVDCSFIECPSGRIPIRLIENNIRPYAGYNKRYPAMHMPDIINDIWPCICRI